MEQVLTSSSPINPNTALNQHLPQSVGKGAAKAGLVPSLGVVALNKPNSVSGLAVPESPKGSDCRELESLEDQAASEPLRQSAHSTAAADIDPVTEALGLLAGVAIALLSLIVPFVSVIADRPAPPTYDIVTPSAAAQPL